MKQFLLPIAIILFAACNNSSTEEKSSTAIPAPEIKKDTAAQRIENAVKKIARADLEAGGYKIDFMIVDSVLFYPASMKDFLQNRLQQLQVAMQQLKAINTRMQQRGIKINVEKNTEDSLKSISAEHKLEDMIASADTALNLLRVTYKITGKTTGAAYNTNYQKFLRKDNLGEITINF